MRLIAFLALALAGPLAAQSAPAGPNPIELGRKYTAWFYTGQSDSLWAHLSPGMKEDLKQPAELLSGLDELVGRVGNETEVVAEKMVRRNGKPQYWRTALFERGSEAMMLRWVILEDGTIDGIGMNPASQAPPVDPGSLDH